MAQSVLEMAKDLVMAQIQVGALPREEMHKELQKTYASLIELKNKEEAGETVAGVSFSEKEEAPPESSKAKSIPTNWKQSIKKHVIICMVCGAAFKQLSVRHLKEHNLDARSYRMPSSAFHAPSRCLPRKPRRCARKSCNAAVHGRRRQPTSRPRSARTATRPGTLEGPPSSRCGKRLSWASAQRYPTVQGR